MWCSYVFWYVFVKSTFFPLLDCRVIRVLPPSLEEIKVAKDQEKEEKILGKRKKRFFPPYNVFKYELQQLDSDNHDLKIVEANDIRREPGIYMRRKNLLFLKNMMEFDKNGGSYYRVLKSVREKYDLDSMPFDEIFSGPEPEFETDIKPLPDDALFSDEDDSNDSAIANSKKPKEEFMEIPLEKDSGLCGKYWETPAKRSNSHWWPPNTALSATSASGSKMTTTADDQKNDSLMELAAEIAAQSTPPKKPTSVSGQPAPEETTSDPQQASNFRQPSPKMSSDVITTTASTSSGPGEVCTF